MSDSSPCLAAIASMFKWIIQPDVPANYSVRVNPNTHRADDIKTFIRVNVQSFSTTDITLDYNISITFTDIDSRSEFISILSENFPNCVIIFPIKKQPSICFLIPNISVTDLRNHLIAVNSLVDDEETRIVDLKYANNKINVRLEISQHNRVKLLFNGGLIKVKDNLYNFYDYLEIQQCKYCFLFDHTSSHCSGPILDYTRDSTLPCINCNSENHHPRSHTCPAVINKYNQVASNLRFRLGWILYQPCL